MVFIDFAFTRTFNDITKFYDTNLDDNFMNFVILYFSSPGIRVNSIFFIPITLTSRDF